MTGVRGGLTSTSSDNDSPSAADGPSAPAADPARLPFGFTPRKSLGQHFLTDEHVLRRIADAAELTRADTVIEIGAGPGGLTVELAARARRVVAVELDERLCAHLADRFHGTNVTVVQGNALDLDPADLLPPDRSDDAYTLTGNLPYYITQPLIRHYLEATPAPRRMTVMVQREVARSIAAKPGEMSLLSVSVQLYGEPTILFDVPSSAFHPPPNVDSSVVRIDLPGGLRAPVTDTEAFFRVVRAGFSSRRKQLRNALANGLQLDPAAAGALLAEAGIDATLRPQALAIESWAAITDAWVAAGRPERTR